MNSPSWLPSSPRPGAHVAPPSVERKEWLGASLRSGALRRMLDRSAVVTYQPVLPALERTTSLSPWRSRFSGRRTAGQSSLPVWLGRREKSRPLTVILRAPFSPGSGLTQRTRVRAERLGAVQVQDLFTCTGPGWWWGGGAALAHAARAGAVVLDEVQVVQDDRGPGLIQLHIVGPQPFSKA